MLKFKTESFVPDDEATNLWVYNGLDCCLTYEIWEKLKTQFNTNTATITSGSLAPKLWPWK